MQVIETDRLLIRNFTADDGPALEKMIVQYQQSPYAKYDHPWPTDPAEIRAVAKWFSGGDHYLAVCLKASGVFIGFVCLNPEERDGEAALNIGYIFDSDYHGQGYATEACRAALARAFDALGAAYVVTGTAKDNVPSVRLLERLGLREMGEGMFWISRDGWRGRRRAVPACPIHFGRRLQDRKELLVEKYPSREVRLAEFDVTGFTKVVSSGGEQYREVRDDGRWEALKCLGVGNGTIYCVASLDRDCRPQGHYRYTIGLKATLSEVESAGLRGEVFSLHIPASQWVVFTLASFGAQYGGFWQDDPYQLIAALGWDFNSEVGLHIDVYAPSYVTDEDSMEFMVPVRKRD